VSSDEPQKTLADDHGAFAMQLRCPERGRVRLYASIPNVGLAQADVAPGDLGAPLTLCLEARGGKEVAGVLLDKLGRPQAGVNVVEMEAAVRTVTDAHGRFSLRYCVPELVQLLVPGASPGDSYQRLIRSGSPKMSDLRIVVKPAR